MIPNGPAGPGTPDFRVVFQATPGINLLLAPDPPRFTMLAASDERLLATMTTREGTLGRGLFDVLSAARHDLPERAGASSLRASFDRVLRTRAPHRTDAHPFEVTRPDGTSTVRYWTSLNVPVLATDGRVAFIVHHVDDVTDQVRAAGWTTQLHVVASALSLALTPPEVADGVARHAVPALGADASQLGLLTNDGRAVMLVDRSAPPASPAAWPHLPAAARTPLADATRTGEPVVLEDGDAIRARYPAMAAVAPRLGPQAAAALPLVFAEQCQGAIAFVFSTPRAFAADELAFMGEVAAQCAQALARARIFTAARTERADADAARVAAEAMRERAEAASRAKSEFLAKLSHELRTPLTAIGGYAELLELGIRGPVTPQQREDLARIQRSQRHLLGLINEVLSFARLETGMVRYEIDVVSIADVMAAAEVLVSPQVSAKRLDLSITNCEPGILAHADIDKLEQIVLNLLSNAIKFTSARAGRPGRVTVTCDTEDGAAGRRMVIRVADTGVGIPADKLEAIFEPYVQVNASLDREHGGTGLGLTISRDLARGMGGDIAVASVLGEGTTFTLTLPAA